MKDAIRKLCCKFGIYYPLNYIRQIPAIIKWLQRGCQLPAPHAVKMSIVKRYLKQHKLKKFIETGTFLGDTLQYIAHEDVDCISIELSKELHRKALKRFEDVHNVSLLQGDSAVVLPKLLESLDEPALFWLDGHYSAGISAMGDKHSPISAELNAIFNHPIVQHVILIDDARCFDGTNDYPHLDDLLLKIRKEGNYRVEVTTDIIRLVPRTNNRSG